MELTLSPSASPRGDRASRLSSSSSRSRSSIVAYRREAKLRRLMPRMILNATRLCETDKHKLQ